VAKSNNKRTVKSPDAPIRIAKAIASAGLCSRREAERWIEAGRVSVNGKKLETPAFTVTPSDNVIVDDKPLPRATGVRLWRYHKPKGLMTTHNDPEGRRTVFDALPADMPRVISIGRLDYATEGLLLLTTSGDLARHMELPATGWLRRYRVRAKGTVTQDALDKLKDGVEIDGIRYHGIEARLDRGQGANVWLTMGLREGKNREVKRVAAHLGLDVNRLIRISFGPFALGDLPAGQVEEIKPRILADQLGAKLAGEFGLKATGKHAEAAPKSKTLKFRGKKPPRIKPVREKRGSK
jgi:23S rRNA pseudouridine2605 synthase